jgi:Sec-independent protein translocase protein TatA
MLADIFGMDGVIVVAIVGVILFAGSRLPKLARSTGNAKVEFRKGLSGEADDMSSLESSTVDMKG